MSLEEQDSFQPGDQVVYHEEYGEFLCRVLENNSGSDLISYKLEVLRTIYPTRFRQTLEPGKVVELSAMRNCPPLGAMGWELERHIDE